ncbi:MAG: tetratricopeptide repeat protein [Planctomycetota bacterium]
MATSPHHQDTKGTKDTGNGDGASGRAARALVAALLLGTCIFGAALAARAADADGYAYGPRTSRAGLRRALDEVHRARARGFLAIAIGSGIGILALAAIHGVWKLAPKAARIIAPVGLALATARMTGLYLLYGGSTDASTSAVATWAFLAVAIGWVYRVPLKVGARKSLRWLRVRTRRVPTAGAGGGPGEDGKAGGASARAGRDPKIVDAERAAEEALSMLDRGEVDSAVERLRRSIGIAPTKRAYTYLGTILGARGEHEAALVEIGRALELAPGFTEALDEKARLLDAVGRSEEARDVRERLRIARGGGPSVAARGPEITRCPACDRELAPGSESCECGVSLTKCASCGRSVVPLRAREGVLLCARCRTRQAAGHAKGRGILAEARTSSGPPPWLAAAAFAGAVLLGAVLSFPYKWLREVRGRGRLAALVAEVGRALDAQGGVPDAEAGAYRRGDEFARAQRTMLARDAFLEDHPAVLKTSLAIYGLDRARELDAKEPELARVARDWARRRLVEADAVIRSGGLPELTGSISHTLKDKQSSLDVLLDRRRRVAVDLSRGTGTKAAGGSGETDPEAASRERTMEPERPSRAAPAEVKRDWRKVWSMPEAGTVFYIERFRRVSMRDPRARVVGSHKDGSTLAADGLIRCEVVKPATGDLFALRMVEVPFEVREADAPPGRYPPAARLVPPSDAAPRAGPFRVEFGKGLEFRALVREPAETLVTRESLHAAKDIPHRRLPIFAPGMAESWEQDETLLWPYPGAQPTRGPCLRQQTRWLLIDKGVAGVGIAWFLRYRPLSKRYSRRIVQNWTSGRPWWNVYDDGILFFRTRPDPAAAGHGAGKAVGR